MLNYFGYKPETDSQLRDLQLIKVVMPYLKVRASSLHDAYSKETQLLTAISQKLVKNDFDIARSDLLDARNEKEHCEKMFFEAKRVAEWFKFDVPEGYPDYLWGNDNKIS